MILLIGSYHDVDASRRGELRECLRRNAENELLQEIHVFVEDSNEPNGLESSQSLNFEKIRLIPHGRRVTFRDLFDYANRVLAGCGVIIANADIFFDQTLARLDGYNLAGRLLCLSRWDVQPDGSAHFFEHPSSQDAWIFQAPIREFHCDFHMGMLGCDNRLAWEAQQAGLKLSNPSRSLRAYHLHLTQVRRYTEQQRLTGPAKSIPAVVLETPYPSARGPAPDMACAGVAFSETMGYTIARLEAGASSHNNDPRPFTAIPEPLVGLPFTQVVANAVSPVEVEFLSPGKLYVLVGNDWEGCHWVAPWLCETGYREGLPLVETESGAGFEVWSLIGDTGERLVIPTQVVLVADHIERK